MNRDEAFHFTGPRLFRWINPGNRCFLLGERLHLQAKDLRDLHQDIAFGGALCRNPAKICHAPHDLPSCLVAMENNLAVKDWNR